MKVKVFLNQNNFKKCLPRIKGFDILLRIRYFILKVVLKILLNFATLFLNYGDVRRQMASQGPDVSNLFGHKGALRSSS